MSDANEVAILIDGYCMFVNHSTHSLWRTILHDSYPMTSRDSSISGFSATPSTHITSPRDDNDEDDDDDELNGDYADVLAPDYQIDRKQISMIESLGNGQFGEVYRGILKVKSKDAHTNRTSPSSDLRLSNNWRLISPSRLVKRKIQQQQKHSWKKPVGDRAQLSTFSPLRFFRCDAKIRSYAYHQAHRCVHRTACLTHHGTSTIRRGSNS